MSDVAALVDHARRRRIRGHWRNLESLMVTAQLDAQTFDPPDRIGYAERTVRSAIRRGALTAARQELVMNLGERAEWERENPLPVEAD